MATTPSPIMGAPIPISGSSNPENFGADMLAMVSALEKGSIPTFTDVDVLRAKFPPPQDVSATPPFVRIFTTGEAFDDYYRYDPVVGDWTPIAGFAGLSDTITAGTVAPIVNPGNALGVMSTSEASTPGQRRVIVSVAIGVTLATSADVVECQLKVNGTKVRQAAGGAGGGFVSVVLPTYTFFANPGAGFTLEVIYSKRSGTGSCQVVSDPAYTNLQYTTDFL